MDRGKVIKRYMTSFAEKHNFRFTRPTVLTRENDSVLQMINFDLPPRRVYCTIALQPLYYPTDMFTLSFGSRLNHFKTVVPGLWGIGTTVQELEKDLSEIESLLKRNAIPWFQEFGSPDGIVSFISGQHPDTPMVMFHPLWRRIYLGFTYLYLGKYDLAETVLSHAVDDLQNDTRKWVVDLKKLIYGIRMLAQNEPDKVRGQLEEFIQQTKANLKLP